jgi:hypothetical protein
MSGGGGSSGTQQVTQTNLPEYARPYYEGAMDSALVESGRPYVQYEGPRIAGFNEFQQGAFNQVGSMTSPYGMDLANVYGGNAAAAGIDQLNKTGNWQTGQFDYSRFIDPTNPEDYMSPYMRNVADITKREAVRDYDVQGLGRDAQAVKQGAYGGYRQAIENSEAGRNLNQQLQDIDYKAQQDAYTNAQGQFNADRNARLAQQQALEQSRQFGGNLGIQGLQASSGLLSGLTNLGQTDQGLQMDRIGALASAGDTMQGQQQQAYDMSYNDFLAQQDWTKEQLSFFNSILRGLPVETNSTQTTYSPAPNMFSQLGGAGLAALGASQAA